MLVQRAFVLSVNKRALLGIAVVALSVAYALLAAAAASGLKGAGEALSEEALDPGAQVVARDGGPLPLAAVETAQVRVWEEDEPDARVGTIEPWTHGDAAIASPYASREAAQAVANDAGHGLRVEAGLRHADARAVYLPPEAFHARHPQAEGPRRAYWDEPPRDIPGGLVLLPASGAEAFYVEGARQIGSGLFLVVAGSGAIVAILSAGVMRLEVLARRQDLATMEALGGRRQARRAVVGRAVFLTAVGAAAGTAASFAVVDVLRSAGGPGFSVTPGWTLFILGLTAAASVGAGSWAGLRSLKAPLSERLGRRGIESRPFGGPVRFLAVSPRLFAGVLGAALVTTAIFSVVLAAASVPVRLFQPEDGTVLYGEVTGNPFRGQADRFLGTLASRFEGIEGASPETYAPTVINGKPLLVRGVDVENWTRLTGARLTEGRWPAGPGEATLGVRAARSLGAGPGGMLLVPASYQEGLAALRVVGIHGNTGFTDDEALTDLDTAGALAGLPKESAHAIRLRLSDAEAATDLARAGSVVVLAVEVHGSPVPLTNATVVIEAANRAGSPVDHTFVVRVNGEKVQEVHAALAPRSVTEVPAQVFVPDASRFLVEVNPSAAKPTGAVTLRIEAPSRVDPNATFGLTVRNAQGGPVEGAEVRAAGNPTTTDGGGNATLRAGAPALLLLSAQKGDLQGGRLVRVAPPEWDNRSVLAVEEVFIEPLWSDEDADPRVQADVRLANLGGAGFRGSLNWSLAGNGTNTPEFSLNPASRITVSTLIGVPPGRHDLAILDRVVAIDFAAQAAPEAGSGGTYGSVEELIAARERAANASVSPQARTQAFLQDTFEDLETATAVVLIVTAVHTGAAIWVSVVREARERARILEVLRSLGADRASRMTRAVRDALLAVLPALAAGILAAWVLLGVGRWFGLPAAFGHTLPAAVDAGFVLRLATLFLVIAAAAAAYAVATSGERPLDAAPRRPLKDLLEGDA